MRDPNRTIGDLVGEYVGKLGEKIEIRRFVRFQLGENLDGNSPPEGRRCKRPARNQGGGRGDGRSANGDGQATV